MSDVHKNGADAATKAAEAATETFKQAEKQASRVFEGLDMGVPEAVRTFAERTVSQSREAYETAKGSMEDAVEVLEKSIDKTGQGTAALNRKVIDITQTNLNSGFDLAKDLAGARNMAEVMELQSSYLRKQFETLTGQAEDLRALSVEVARNATDPITAHVSRSFDKIAVK